MVGSAGRLSGSPVGLLGNLVFILLAAAGLWVLWTDPRVYAWLTTYSMVVILVFVLLLCLFIWAARSFTAASCTFGALAIISLGLFINFSELVLAMMIPVSRILASLFVAALVVFFWISSFLNNLYALTHTKERDLERTLFYLEQTQTKDHVKAMLSRVEEFSKVKDKRLLEVLRETFDSPPPFHIIKDIVETSGKYYQYAGSTIDRITKKVR